MALDKDARHTTIFMLILAIGACVYYDISYLQAVEQLQNKAAFASDFGMFHAIAQLLSWPLPPFTTIYDLAQGQDFLKGLDVSYIPYLYLPHFLLALAPLKGLDFWTAYSLWMGVQLVLYMAVILCIRPYAIQQEAKVFQARTGFDLRQPLIIIALLHLTHLVVAGHPSILAAVLVYAGFQLLSVRPVMAGICFALACYKPQMGVMLPVLLLAGRHWRASIAFGISGFVLFAASTALFGWEFWPHYLAIVQQHGQIMLDVPEEIRNQAMGVYTAMRMIGAPAMLANSAQIISILVFCGLLGLAAWKREGLATMGLLFVGPFLISPYVMLYDSIMLVPAVGVLLLTETLYPPALWRRLCLIIAISLPLTAVVVQNWSIPLGCIIVLIMLGNAAHLLFMKKDRAALTEN